ncbi:MAG: 4-alpha-glucanotransferase, partial [Planctomycetota bacterium]|nr:4-alpha-glucanotransferase [Planctomycetota bacterium]
MIFRASGLLLHVTSLPGGSLGPAARRFVDFCAKARQRYWQVLPIHPPDAWGSPYAALSAFAGHEGLLGRTRARIDAADYGAFVKRERYWLEDYALYRALRDAHGGKPWHHWPRPLRDRTARALAKARTEHADAIETVRRDQFRFQREWAALKEYAEERGVRLIGDMPIFVAHDSADVWAHRTLFRLQRNGRPKVVTGVPPDYFNKNGQRWGNPHYAWDVMKRRRFRWWVARVRRLLDLHHAVRVDHFLGFSRAWEIPARAKTARKGRWGAAPGAALFRTLQREFGVLPFIAEDLGLVTDEADRLRRRFSLPGMKVLQFSFGPNAGDRPHNFAHDSVVYTGTHDNDTTRGWTRSDR